jgi:hypothetical protein
MRRAVLLVLPLAVSAVTPAARAAGTDPTGDAVAHLRDSAIYQGAAQPKISPSELSGSTLSGIKVAILPTGGPDPVTVAQDIGRGLDTNHHGLTVLVFEGTSFGAASTSRCGVGTAIQDAVSAHRSELQQTDDVTATVRDFAAAVHKAPSAAHGCGTHNGTGGSSTGEDSGSSGSSHTGLIVLLVILALIAAGIGWWVWSRRRRRQRELAEARAEVMPYYERLAAEINGLDPKDDKTARQALADAAERYNSTGSQLATADTVEKYARARRTALEGLYAARTARRALGLDEGPELPPIAETSAPHLDRPQDVTVQGQTFQGYPSYTPGAPYYYGGGYGVPGGWYSFPFWETLLIGSMLGGGFGFGGGWGGYGAGYDTGFASGYEEGAESADDRGAGGWGDSGGGGDWSSGWGDSGGGGDWGGGGGDWGGGDSGGGSW